MVYIHPMVLVWWYDSDDSCGYSSGSRCNTNNTDTYNSDDNNDSNGSYDDYNHNGNDSSDNDNNDNNNDDNDSSNKNDTVGFINEQNATKCASQSFYSVIKSTPNISINKITCSNVLETIRW